MELRLRIQFPEQCRDFLLTYNVAVPEPNQFVSADVTTSVELFLGLGKTPLNGLFEQNRVMYGGRLPDEILAIARASGGNLICLSLPDGSIYFWDHEHEATEGEAPGFRNLTTARNRWETSLCNQILIAQLPTI